MEKRDSNMSVTEAPEAVWQPSPVGRSILPFGPEGGEPAGELTVLRFGNPGARPKAYLQAGLHADELPGMLVLRDLATRLEEAALRGEILGEIILLPVSNPIGLAQLRHDHLQGRFDEQTGENFNRGYAYLADLVQGHVAGLLGDDPAANAETIRAALREAVAALRPDSALQGLRKALLGLACDADLVLDLHADNQALMHLYTAEALWPAAEDIAAELDARAVLLCDLSGGNPFDEACSAPWWTLAAAFPDKPVPNACLAATVELRSNNEVEARLVESDAAALFRVLTRRGLVTGEVDSLPRLLCEATPLKAMQQIRSPGLGIVTYHARLGDRVTAGDLVATLTDPLGDSIEILAETEGRLFARHEQLYAWPGKVIGKIAGTEILPDRVGDLLTN